MDRFHGVPIQVADPPLDDRANALPILHEIRHALKRLADLGEPSVIDLLSIPFGPGDEARLLAALGEGEVKASVDALGPTQVWESGYPGVWLVDHRNPEGQRMAFHVEISPVPQILRSQDGDIRESCTRLQTLLGQSAEQHTWPSDRNDKEE